MIFKILCTIMLTLALGVGSSMAAMEDVTTGTFSSFKSLEVQYACYKDDCTEYVMIEDMIRTNERLKNDGGPDYMVVGVHRGLGKYQIAYVMPPFGVFPMGMVDWSQIVDAHPSWKVLGDFRPVKFQTADGFEDIYVYFEFSDADIEGIKSLIRELNTENLKQYEGI